MKAIKTFSIIPSLPDKLKPLLDIAYNLWWTWDSDAVELFRRIDRELWRDVNHNPIALLGAVDKEIIEKFEKNESFLDHLDNVHSSMKEYMGEKTWYDMNVKEEERFRIAYLSAEFGIHESLPMYSGGLGILAGDHLKSASEMGIPLAGVGIAYSNGYFNQILKEDGWQMERYPENDFYNMPMQLQRKENGEILFVEVDFPDGKAYAQVWKQQIGRVPLYLLDTNIPKNPQSLREITLKLYGGDNEMRIKQEILLGIGGVRALHALGLDINVFHMNEGHSAFLIFERVRELMYGKKMSFEEACEAVTAGSVFTTHTPVPAGNDRFSSELMRKYLLPYKEIFGITFERFLGMGRENPLDASELFCMTVLALKLSCYSNGVSKLHGTVSRKMWKKIWPAVPTDEVPISSITNGIHTSSWLSDEMKILFDRYIGKRWRTHPADHSIWKRLDNIPDAELWRGHERMRERLIGFTRKRLQQGLSHRGATASEIAIADEVLDPGVMTIGFSRRMAEYKRAYLLFMDIERLDSIINNKERPVQIIIAGKAHPHDNVGKEIIKSILSIAKQERFRKKIVFIENYDIRVARYLVQGIDVWVSTPRRPLEASGTSGMKVQVNGGINVSILDGWWCEAFNGENGWAIGSGETSEDKQQQDQVESRLLYNILEKEVIPKFYERSSDTVPKEWVRLIKNAMMTICPIFNTNRMIREYFEKFYIGASNRSRSMAKNDYEMTRNVVQVKSRLLENWSNVTILNVGIDDRVIFQTKEDILVQADVRLGFISPEEVQVEAYYGSISTDGELTDGNGTLMACDLQRISGDGKEKSYHYSGTVRLEKSGHCGISIRVLPKKTDLINNFIPGLINWAQP